MSFLMIVNALFYLILFITLSAGILIFLMGMCSWSKYEYRRHMHTMEWHLDRACYGPDKYHQHPSLTKQPDQIVIKYLEDPNR